MPFALRPVVAGGDATTDISMPRRQGRRGGAQPEPGRTDVPRLRQRQRALGREPDVHQPAAAEAGLVPLPTTAYTDAKGNPGPVRRNDGSIIPDQADTVFGQA
ncbi:MAG: hypothetical protein R2719_14255 [Micropruina sp.]